MEYPVTSFVQMYPTVGALPIAAITAAMGVAAAPASPRPARAAPPRPARPAAPRRPRAAPSRSPAAADGLAAAAAGAAGFIAATTGLRSSSVDHRRIRILTGLPDSLTFADVAVRLTSPVPAASARGATASLAVAERRRVVCRACSGVGH